MKLWTEVMMELEELVELVEEGEVSPSLRHRLAPILEHARKSRDIIEHHQAESERWQWNREMNKLLDADPTDPR